MFEELACGVVKFNRLHLRWKVAQAVNEVKPATRVGEGSPVLTPQ